MQKSKRKKKKILMNGTIGGDTKLEDILLIFPVVEMLAQVV